MNQDPHQQLDRYHDGEMTDDQKRDFEQRLSAEPILAEQLNRLRRISRQFDLASRPPVAELTRARFHQAIASESQRELSRLAGLLTTAAAMVLLLCSFLMWRGPGVTPSAITWDEDPLFSSEIADQADDREEVILAEWIVTDLTERSRP